MSEEARINKEPQVVKFEFAPFYLDLPNGEEFVKNPRHSDFWDSV
jgi:hypothetical protein